MRISDWSSDVCSSDLASHAVRGSVNYATMVGDEDFRVNGWANYIGPSRLGIGPVLGESQGDYVNRSEERRVGKEVSVRVDLGGRRLLKKKKYIEKNHKI